MSLLDEARANAHRSGSTSDDDRRWRPSRRRPSDRAKSAAAPADRRASPAPDVLASPGPDAGVSGPRVAALQPHRPRSAGRRGNSSTVAWSGYWPRRDTSRTGRTRAGPPRFKNSSRSWRSRSTGSGRRRRASRSARACDASLRSKCRCGVPMAPGSPTVPASARRGPRWPVRTRTLPVCRLPYSAYRPSPSLSTTLLPRSVSGVKVSIGGSTGGVSRAGCRASRPRRRRRRRRPARGSRASSGCGRGRPTQRVPAPVDADVVRGEPLREM